MWVLVDAPKPLVSLGFPEGAYLVSLFRCGVGWALVRRLWLMYDLPPIGSIGPLTFGETPHGRKHSDNEIYHPRMGSTHGGRCRPYRVRCSTGRRVSPNGGC